MQPRDFLTELAHQRKRIQVLMGFIGRMRQEAYERGQRIVSLETERHEARQQIEGLTEGLAYWKEEALACETNRGQRHA